MTTNELKSYIDRILGNNIRLLLPSYWWKRAFGAVIDKVDEKVEKSDLKTINGESVLGEGDLRVGVKSVESLEALAKLDAEVGDIASVLGRTEPTTVKFADCYASVDYENDWDKYTIIRRVEENSQTLPESGAAVYLTASNEALSKDCVAVGYVDYMYTYMKFTNGKDEFISLQQANELLASGKYRAAIGYSASDVDQYFTFYTKVAEDTADAYIKSDSWEKLAKEYVVSSEEELNRLDAPVGSIARIAYDGNKKINLFECKVPSKQDNEESIIKNWDEYTRIAKIESAVPVGSDTSVLFLIKFFNPREDEPVAAISFDKGTCIVTLISSNNGEAYYEVSIALYDYLREIIFNLPIDPNESE